MNVLEKILFSFEGDSFEGTFLATISRGSASVICVAYLLIYYTFAEDHGFVFDTDALFRYLTTFSDLFNSLSIIIIVCFFSIASIIPGFAALFLGLIKIRSKPGKKTALWGLFGFFVGAINFYILFKIYTPA